MSILPIGKRRPALYRKTPRLYLSVSSEGYGHSSRAVAIASQFDPGDVLIGTYGYALDRVRAFGYSCVAVPQEVKFVGDQGSFDVSKTILKNPSRALSFNQIVQEEMTLMADYDVSLVVADGRMAPVLAAARMDIPCVVVTNQSAFYPFFARDSALVRLFGLSFEWMMKFWLSSAEEILIPDFPPPETICLPNLSDNFKVKKRTRFVGPLVAWRAEDITPCFGKLNKPRIVVSMGGHSYRRPLFDTMLRVARQMPELHFDLICSFTTEVLPENVTLHGTVTDCAPYFASADLVITQAGHSTAMELMTLGKPCLVVPDSRQIEQENNASRMVELGVACQMTYDELSASRMQHVLSHMLATPDYWESARSMAQRAADINGAARAADVLTEYAYRLMAY
jgi:uncharacterized protein (TIGR00661 family)